MARGDDRGGRQGNGTLDLVQIGLFQLCGPFVRVLPDNAWRHSAAVCTIWTGSEKAGWPYRKFRAVVVRHSCESRHPRVPLSIGRNLPLLAAELVGQIPVSPRISVRTLTDHSLPPFGAALFFRALARISVRTDVYHLSPPLL